MKINISISKKRKSKTKSLEAKERSVFLKALFSLISGEKGNALMHKFSSGDNEGFSKDWDNVSKSVLLLAGQRTKGTIKENDNEN